MTAEADAAHDAVLTLLSYAGGIRACAILAEDGAVLASSAELRWRERVEAIFATVGEDEGRLPVEVAVAAAGGELIAIRDADGRGYTAVALADRHALGSLVSSDLRAALRTVRKADG